MKITNTLSTALVAASLSLLIHAPLNAQTDAHHHGHDEHAASALSLNQGKKWETDTPLRKGMLSIKHEAMSAADAFHHDALTRPDAEKLASHITGQVDYLVANCKLEPQADATLHVLIGDLLSGADALSKQPLSSEGLPRIVKVLQLYPDYFEHQGWDAIDHD